MLVPGLVQEVCRCAGLVSASRSRNGGGRCWWAPERPRAPALAVLGLFLHALPARSAIVGGREAERCPPRRYRGCSVALGGAIAVGWSTSLLASLGDYSSVRTGVRFLVRLRPSTTLPL